MTAREARAAGDRIASSVGWTVGALCYCWLCVVVYLLGLAAWADDNGGFRTAPVAAWSLVISLVVGAVRLCWLGLVARRVS